MMAAVEEILALGSRHVRRVITPLHMSAGLKPLSLKGSASPQNPAFMRYRPIGWSACPTAPWVPGATTASVSSTEATVPGIRFVGLKALQDRPACARFARCAGRPKAQNLGEETASFLAG